VSPSPTSIISFSFCEFNHVAITGENHYGGGIYIGGVGSVKVESTSFSHISSESDGGAIFFLFVSSCALISNCSFDSSSASRNGGGIFLSLITIQDSFCSSHSSFGTIFGCLFFLCSSSSSDGGGIYINSPLSEEESVRSCVFEECKGGRDGGGICFTSLNQLSSSSVLIYYSFFFNQNECGINGKGIDVYINTNIFTNPDHSPFISSFTTTEGTNKVNQGGTNKDEWFSTLPSPFMRIVNEEEENSFDSFGCGINESFPCSSVKWVKNHPLPGVEEEIRDSNEEYENNVIYVDEEDGNNENMCGRESLPCSSLSYSSSHFDSSQTKEMKIISSSIHNDSLFSSLSLSLISHDSIEKGIINIYSSFSSSPSSTIMNEGELVIERIIFHSLYSSIGDSSFILSSSGSSLSLSSSSFSFLSDSSLSFSLFFL
jgi:hypothetical protein